MTSAHPAEFEALRRQLRSWLRGGEDRLELARPQVRLLADELSRLQQSNDRLRKQNKRLRRRTPAAEDPAGEAADAAPSDATGDTPDDTTVDAPRHAAHLAQRPAGPVDDARPAPDRG